MKVYVASHSRELAEEQARILVDHGHETTSRWHTKAFHPTSHHTHDECVAVALEDLEDIKAADALVLLAGPDKYSGGKFVEAGIAVGLGKTVVVVGRRENMLLWLPELLVVESMSEAAATLARNVA